MSAQLPTGKEFFRHFTLRFSLVVGSAAILILLYMGVLLRLPPDQARGLWWAVAAVAAVVTPLFSWRQSQFMAGLTNGLDRLAQGAATHAEIERAFATAVDLPRRCALFCLTNFVTATTLAICVMFVFFDFSLQAALLTFAAGASGGLLANVVQFFVFKQIVHPVRTGLAEHLPDPEERGRLVRRFPLVDKIAIVLVTVALVPVVFSVFLAQSRTSSSAEAIGLRLQRAVLDRAAERLAAPGARPEVLADVAQEAERWGIPLRLEIVTETETDAIDANGGGSGEEEDDAATAAAARPLTPDERAWVRASDAATGNALELQSANVVSWLRIEGRRVIAASTPRETFAVGGAQGWLFAAVVSCAALIALLVAALMARDVGLATRSLEAQAIRIADGDLCPAQLLESEDELGGVGRAFARMTTALRATVGRVAHAVGRVEASGAAIGATVERVTASAREQAQATEHCVGSVVAVRAQASYVSDAANALRSASQQSSTSILQMSAAGQQMHETAIVLSANVDEVAASIEQSSRSIAEVNVNTASLSAAAEETSSSMEEMAAAMRQVDGTAEETARLSGNVAEAAEIGQRKVRETVGGMESIRRATDSAQSVIHSLGQRTMKIGAVLEVINDIANRTNLLALNASIIAAQAGEHGRAFAVVGNEIAELATRVRTSTDEIGDLIGAVQRESSNAIGAIETGSASVASGVALAREAGASLDEITQAARASGERSREIVAAVREQSKAAAHVVGMMVQVSGGLGAIRSATEDQRQGHTSIANAARSMADVAQQLRASTEQQAAGIQQIQQSIDHVRDSADAIHVAAESQTESCTSSASLLEELAEHTTVNEDGMRQMKEALGALLAESDTLREDVERFRL